MSGRLPHVTVILTELEADMLSLVVGNGWGDGDFADCCTERGELAALKRAMAKLSKARRKQYEARIKKALARSC